MTGSDSLNPVPNLVPTTLCVRKYDDSVRSGNASFSCSHVEGSHFQTLGDMGISGNEVNGRTRLRLIRVLSGSIWKGTFEHVTDAPACTCTYVEYGDVAETVPVP